MVLDFRQGLSYAFRKNKIPHYYPLPAKNHYPMQRGANKTMTRLYDRFYYCRKCEWITQETAIRGMKNENENR